jgi:hypothetical protein
MRLNEAIEKIKDSISLDADAYEIKLIKRNFIGISKYIAVIAVISKEGLIDDSVIEGIVTMIENGDDEFSIEETQVDMKDFNFDILLINAEINLR